MSQTHSLTGCLALTDIYPLFVDRFERSLRFSQLEFDKKAIPDGCRSKNVRYRCGFLILSDSKELSILFDFKCASRPIVQKMSK